MVVIEFSGGGEYATFDRMVKETISLHEEVQIVGECYSSCTLYLRNPKTCVAPGAKLAFHAWRLVAPGRPIAHDLTQQYVSSYPKKVQDFIAKNGGLGAEWLVLEGPELTSIIKVCDKLAKPTPPREHPEIVTGYAEAPTPWSKEQDNAGAVMSRLNPETTQGSN